MGRTRPRRRLATAQLVTLTAAGSVALVQVPLLLGHQAITTTAVLGVLILCVAWGFPLRHTPLVATHALLAGFAYVACTFVTSFRGSEAGVYANIDRVMSQSLILFTVFFLGVLLVTTSGTVEERNRRMIAVALGPGIYSIANALLYLSHVTAATIDPGQLGVATYQHAELLAAFGVSLQRVQLPLTAGVNTAGIVAGAGLAASIVIIRQGLAPRLISWSCAAGSVFCLLVADTRTSLLLGLLVGGYMAYNRRGLAARWITIIVALLPLIVVVVLRVFGSTLGAIVSGEQGRDFSTASNRTHIWDAAWNMLQHPSLHHLVGWGANGQITSGLSMHYAYLFNGTPSPTTFSTHNLVLQTIFETGYIGLAVLIWLVWVTSSRLVACRKIETDMPIAPLLAVFFAIFLGGATEAAPSYAAPETVVPILMIAGIAAALPIALSRPEPARLTVTAPVATAAQRPMSVR